MEGGGSPPRFHIRKYHAAYTDSYFLAFMNQVSHSRGKLCTLNYKIIHKVSGDACICTHHQMRPQQADLVAENLYRF